LKEVFSIKIKRKAVRIKSLRTRAPIDEIMKYLFSVSKETLVNMLNNLFNQNFSVDNAEISQTNGEFVDENFDITRGDLFYMVTDNSKAYHLHIELQTKADGYMAIRLLKYDIEKAVELQRLSDRSGVKRYVLPSSMVIHVEKNDKIPDSYEHELVDIKVDGTEEIIHRVVPVLKYWTLTDAELVERKLYPLMPLQIFLLRDKLKKFARQKDSADKQKVIQEVKDLTEKIIVEAKNLVLNGKMNAGDDDRIITALDKLIKYLNEQYNFDENLNREVDFMIKSVFTRLREEGVLVDGRDDGRDDMAIRTAEKMILKDEPLEKIIEYSELPEKKIKEIATKLSKKLVVN